MSLPNLTLITGGARAGKSLLAETMAADYAHVIYYLATMKDDGQDNELARRITRHRQRRPHSWITEEVPLGLSLRVGQLSGGPGLVLIDCLSVYIANVLLDQRAAHDDPYLVEEQVLHEVEKLLAAIRQRADLEFIVVTNEVGWSIVPDTAVCRAYRDFLGDANQAVAGAAHSVWLVVSGQKLRLKPSLAYPSC